MYNVRCPFMYFSNKSFNVSICFEPKTYFMQIKIQYDKGDFLKKIIFVLNNYVIIEAT